MHIKKSLVFHLAILFVATMTWGQACSQYGYNRIQVSQQESIAQTPCSQASANPKTISEAVQLINQLPKPVTVSCFLQSLARPLKVSITNSTTSAQPAHGDRSPRVFVFSDQLIISVVPDGPGVDYIEFAELKDGFRSIKAELEFPITSQINLTHAFDRIRYDSFRTVCGFCHSGENPAPASAGYPNAFLSAAFQPVSSTVKPLSSLQNEHLICDPIREPKRCEMLRSIFGFGEVRSQSFPSGMPTMF